MMYTELSFESLKTISNNLVKDVELKKKLDKFLKIKFDKYYIYDKKVFDSSPVIEITVPELKQITTATNCCNNEHYNIIYDDLLNIYKTILAISGVSVFLYGGYRK